MRSRPVQEEVARETARDIGLLFPDWHVWYSAEAPSTWNAHREGEKPYFGPPADNGRVFIVSARDVVSLVAMLERQAQIDVTEEFPDAEITQVGAGDWQAVYRNESATPDSRDAVRVVSHPTVAGLHAALRELAAR